MSCISVTHILDTYKWDKTIPCFHQRADRLISETGTYLTNKARQNWHICSSAETAAATIQGHGIKSIQRVLSTSKPRQLSHCVYLTLQLYCRSKFVMNELSVLPKRTDGVSFSALPCTEKIKHTCGAVIIPPAHTFSVLLYLFR